MEKSARPLKKEVLRGGVSFLLACKKGRKEGRKERKSFGGKWVKRYNPFKTGHEEYFFF